MMQYGATRTSSAGEKSLLKFIEIASVKIQCLEQQVGDFRHTEEGKLHKLEQQFSDFEQTTTKLKSALSNLRIKDINKHLLYKEAEAEKMDRIQQTVSQLEGKINGLDATVKKMNLSMGKIQQVLHERLGPLMQALDSQRTHFEGEIKYVLAKQIEHVRTLQPQLSEIRRKLETAATETVQLKQGLKEMSEHASKIRRNQSEIQKLGYELNSLRDHITAFVEESCSNTLAQSLELAKERLTKPLEELHEKQGQQLVAKLDGLIQRVNELHRQAVNLISSSENMADERYEQIFKAICEICRMLKMENPLE